MRSIASAAALVKAAARAASEDRVPMMGAALAYYAVFSIAPLLVIVIGVAGVVFGQGGGEGVLEAVRGHVGESGDRAVRAMVAGVSSRPRAGAAAAAAGFAVMLVGASGVFGQLQEALNVIWKAELGPGAGWGVAARRRLLSFGMVGAAALVLLVSLVVGAGLSAAGTVVGGVLPGGEAAWQAVNLAVSVGVTSALFAMIFKALPDVRLPWRDALLGGFWTSVLFSLGELAIGLYIGRSGVASAYGAAGSVVALLLWVYYSSQIVLFGAELTRAYVERSGTPVALKEHAVSTAKARGGRPSAISPAPGPSR